MLRLHRRTFQGFSLQYGHADHFFGLFGQGQTVDIRNVLSRLILNRQFDLFPQFIKVHIEAFQDPDCCIVSFADQPQQKVLRSYKIIPQP